MKTKKTIVILHEPVAPDAPEDQKDLLIAVKAVGTALDKLGWQPAAVTCSIDFVKTIDEIRSLRPELVFNLVESLDGRNMLISVPPVMLDAYKIPYTGTKYDGIFATSHKVMAKQMLLLSRIITPDWQTCDEIVESGFTVKPPCILKPVSEDASCGVTDDCVFYTAKDCLQAVQKIAPQERSDYFVEGFISGREFNVSVLERNGQPELLPPAEMTFVDFPQEKPAIVNYAAKWDPQSFEYTHTVRSFDYPPEDTPLLKQLQRITQRCWKLFRLNGYARMDFRVDSKKRPWVIEINANPCISPDSGFIAAAARAGYSYEDVIERIVAAASTIKP